MLSLGLSNMKIGYDKESNQDNTGLFGPQVSPDYIKAKFNEVENKMPLIKCAQTLTRGSCFRFPEM